MVLIKVLLSGITSAVKPDENFKLLYSFNTKIFCFDKLLIYLDKQIYNLVIFINYLIIKYIFIDIDVILLD